VSARSVHAVCPVLMVHPTAVGTVPFMIVKFQFFGSTPGAVSILIPRFEIVPPNGIRCWYSAWLPVKAEVEYGPVYETAFVAGRPALPPMLEAPPAAPGGPVGPVGPVSPVGPGGPVAPVSPVGPGSPVGP